MFVDKFEGALGKGKGKKLYAFKVMMTKVRIQENILRFVDGMLYFHTDWFIVVASLSEMDQVSERF